MSCWYSSIFKEIRIQCLHPKSRIQMLLSIEWEEGILIALNLNAKTWKKNLNFECAKHCLYLVLSSAPTKTTNTSFSLMLNVDRIDFWTSFEHNYYYYCIIITFHFISKFNLKFEYCVLCFVFNWAAFVIILLNIVCIMCQFSHPTTKQNGTHFKCHQLTYT